MKNADKPAFSPTIIVTDAGTTVEQMKLIGKAVEANSLTKREYMATEQLNGIIASVYCPLQEGSPDIDMKKAVSMAIEATDELLKQLDNA